MCGLFLVLERHRPIDAQRAHASTAALRHRGPDGTGHWQFQWRDCTNRDAVPVSGFAGHTRLSIQDLEARSDQPLRRGSKTLVYNGELYNFRSLRDKLATSGSRFETGGDTEVLLELLARQGVNGLSQANGMWAFCMVDEERGQLVAARDRYGKKPLFVYQDDADCAWPRRSRRSLPTLGNVLFCGNRRWTRFYATGGCFRRPMVTPTYKVSGRFQRVAHGLSIWHAGSFTRSAISISPPMPGPPHQNQRN